MVAPLERLLGQQVKPDGAVSPLAFKFHFTRRYCQCRSPSAGAAEEILFFIHLLFSK